MRSEPVYQPTTTSLDASGVIMGSGVHRGGGGGAGGRARSWLPPLTYDPLLASSHGAKGSAWPRSLLLVLALLFAVMGLVMIIVGSTSYHGLQVRKGEGIKEGGGGGGGIKEGGGGDGGGIKEGGGGDGGIKEGGGGDGGGGGGGRTTTEEEKGGGGGGRTTTEEEKGGGKEEGTKEGEKGEEITANETGGGRGGGEGRGGNATAYVLVLCLGILLEVAALGSLWAYCRFMGYYLPCCPGKIWRIRRRFHGHPSRSTIFNGQMASSGTPVSAQYCPPASPPSSLVPAGGGSGDPGGLPPPPRGGSGIALPAPPYTDGSEIEHLIAVEEEGKVDLSDDTERIFDEDPRIVLTPLKSREEC